MPRPGAASAPVKARVAPEDSLSSRPAQPAPRAWENSFAEWSQPGDRAFAERSQRAEPRADEPARRTVTITGHGSEGYASRHGTSPSMAERHRQLPRHERAGFRPDRAAMWAVLLGVILMLAAATSSHAATLAAHALR